MIVVKGGDVESGEQQRSNERLAFINYIQNIVSMRTTKFIVRDRKDKIATTIIISLIPLFFIFSYMMVLAFHADRSHHENWSNAEIQSLLARANQVSRYNFIYFMDV
jgi:hypothetical protein